MASQSSISMFPDPDVIEDIAAEMGISSAFVEKDWYAVQALKALAEHESDGFQAIFSGGTSLSKGYGLIQRFSEDLDFRCLALQSGSFHRSFARSLDVKRNQAKEPLTERLSSKPMALKILVRGSANVSR